MMAPMVATIMAAVEFNFNNSRLVVGMALMPRTIEDVQNLTATKL